MKQNNIEIRNSCGGDKKCLIFTSKLNLFYQLFERDFLVPVQSLTLVIHEIMRVLKSMAYLVLYCDCQQMPLQLNDVRLQ